MVFVLLYIFTPIPSLTNVIYMICRLLFRWLSDKESSCSAGDSGNMGSILELGYPGVGLATHSSILAWSNPWTKEPDIRLESMGSQRVRHEWSDWTHMHISYRTLSTGQTNEKTTVVRRTICWQHFTRIAHNILLLLFSHSVVSDSLPPHELQHTRIPCPSPSPGACSNSCPLSQWCPLPRS